MNIRPLILDLQGKYTAKKVNYMCIPDYYNVVKGEYRYTICCPNCGDDLSFIEDNKSVHYIYKKAKCCGTQVVLLTYIKPLIEIVNKLSKNKSIEDTCNLLYRYNLYFLNNTHKKLLETEVFSCETDALDNLNYNCNYYPGPNMLLGEHFVTNKKSILKNIINRKICGVSFKQKDVNVIRLTKLNIYMPTECVSKEDFLQVYKKDKALPKYSDYTDKFKFFCKTCYAGSNTKETCVFCSKKLPTKKESPIKYGLGTYIESTRGTLYTPTRPIRVLEDIVEDMCEEVVVQPTIYSTGE